MSPVAKRYVKAILIGILFAIITMLLGFLPYDDFLQGMWVFISAFITATVALKKRIKEDDSARYTRLAKSYFNYWIKKNPSLVEGLFAANVSYSVVEWLKEETGCNLMECSNPHVVDSWSKVGDEPGELMFRSGFEFGKMVQEQEQSNVKLEDFISQKLQKFAKEQTHFLGKEIAPKVFYKELLKGENRPVGIYLSNPESECLAVYERQEHEGETIALNKVSFSLKKTYLQDITDHEWLAVKDIVYKHFPYFKPIAGGSGPQKKEVPLFLTEKNLTPQELKNFPENAVKVYQEVKSFLQKETKQEETKQEETKQEETNK